MKRHLFTLLFLVAALSVTQAQTDSDAQPLLSHIKRALRFSMFYPQEKVYLHLDNTSYFKGETIWFKAYVTRVDTEQATDLSKVLYVELLNPSGDIVARRKLHIENGMAHGDIQINQIMVTGFYEIRAFTRYMTNWGTNACFSRVIPIFKAPQHEGDYSDPQIDQLSYRHRLNDERLRADDDGNGNIVDLSQIGTKTKAAKATSTSLNVRFYPEGGQLVKGLPARIAFTVTGADGLPMQTDVSLTDPSGTALSLTSTDADGRGIFTLPADLSTAQLQVKKEGGGTTTFPLPPAADEGCTMQVDVMDEQEVRIDLHASAAHQGHAIGYVLVRNGKIVQCDTLTAQPHQVITLHRSKLSEGVHQLTFFGSDGHILAERRFFIFPPAQPDHTIQLTPSSTIIQPCGKVQFSLSAPPHSSLSFSAVDANGYLNGRTGNIRTWMLLASDLRGYIAHPDYYLESDDETHRRATDLLMLVQGWRRYDWRLMTGQSLFEKYQTIETQLNLFGHLGNKKFKKQDIANVWIEATLANQSDQVVEGTTQTDSLGNYVFTLPDIYGEWNLYINTGVADKKGFWKDADYFVGIDRHFSPAPRHLSPSETAYTPVSQDKPLQWKVAATDQQWVSITDKDHVLQNVTVKAKGRVWDRTGWGDERNAQRASNIYYDCEEAADRIADEGQITPAFGDWLKSKNSFFGGESTPTQLYIAIPDTTDPSSASSSTGKKIIRDFSDFDPQFSTGYDLDPPTGYILLNGNGLTYKNRPIVWIVDNQFCTITNCTKRGEVYIALNDNNSNTSFTLPIGLEDVKSVYISEELEAMHTHLLSSEIDAMNPVVIYVYTHRSATFKRKGLRTTHFQGYNEPSTFQMEDYSVLPPMEDHRRTLFWAPDVQTDDQGHATIEFFNNSSCSEMYLSTEGMTPQGKFMVNE